MSKLLCWHVASKYKDCSHLIGCWFGFWLCFCLFTTIVTIINFIYIALLQPPKCFLNKIRASSFSSSTCITFMVLMIFLLIGSKACVWMCVFLRPGGPAAFSPGNLSTSSSASSTLGSPDNDEYILSFETIDKMRRVSSYSSLNSLIGNSLSIVLQLYQACLCVSFQNTLFQFCT